MIRKLAVGWVTISLINFLKCYRNTIFVKGPICKNIKVIKVKLFQLKRNWGVSPAELLGAVEPLRLSRVPFK